MNDEIDRIFEYILTRGSRGEPDLVSRYIAELRGSAKVSFLNYLFAPIISLAGSRRKCDLLIFGHRFDSLYRTLASYCQTGTVQTGLWAAFHDIQMGRPFAYAGRSKETLAQAYVNKTSRRKITNKAIANLASSLEAIQPKAILLENDSLFLERTLIVAAQRMHVPVFTIQHGIFMSNSPPHVLDGHFGGNMLVWGDFFRDMLISKGVCSAEKIAVLGYPSRPRLPSTSSPSAGDTHNKICFLGQPWGRYASSLEAVQDDIVREVSGLALEAGVPFTYRPHPGENRNRLAALFNYLQLTPPGQSLEETLDTQDIFISVSSTALAQAGLSGRVAIQIFDERFGTDDFNVIGVCPSVPGDSSSLRKLIHAIVDNDFAPQAISSVYIHVPADPAKELLRILKRFGVTL